jgi:hypothetical protein
MSRGGFMQDKYRCLTCYQVLTKKEYEEHKKEGHVTLEYIEYEKDSTPEVMEED